ncbi:hypothetical protein ThrDRAFT_00088 [Frankia casuarinae]|jgi:hypothetical protein|uniref:hypothetical protein n=1 Tax=Frankia TaxID=1854 RepID=UPI0003D019B8|nr:MULTISPECIES: hypothetical protein [Frankia]ETA02763.1 hypothetical protein CcI6DRAFT_01723 [Frankia sp. CcI6]EYT94164.1 hypothetical protein ThrDRAFT_00088 [Frankia casuarinae]KDA44356.1 hypothetical protein BMG523Draft_00855 [Frankia sp. BMG5.23]KEZ35046.1 hypothetical protein CEDDRAFT_03596 [Frankia sp. CeD]KFB06798.1 hypothetical protein ALLO2DRAFT_00084 [Frankia sp. Allo2]
MKKIFWPYGVGLFALFFAVTAPGNAADVVHSAVGALGGVADGLSTFVSQAAT